MIDSLFSSVFDLTGVVTIDLTGFIVCLLTAIGLGIFMAKMYLVKSKSTKGFIVTLAMLPVAVAMVILMVNGNIGTGVAVAGAFSLIRFRSVPGTAKEISAIFSAMCAGLTVGMGYIAFAILFSIIICAFSIFLDAVCFADDKNAKLLIVTIPEDLNYTNVFDDIFENFTNNAELLSVKTTNMGSLFKVKYEIKLKADKNEKDFINEIRCRNANLEIVIASKDLSNDAL
ncbi:MAG: DUF4956 domain-containing protein [Clostridia bacterium]